MRRILLMILLALAARPLPAQTGDGTLTLSSDGKPWLTYNTDFIESPDVDAPWYGRSGFIHPLCTPNGHVITAGFPADHMHQHGLMFAWTSGKFDGHAVDFWNSAAKQGRIEHVETIRSNDDQIVVRLRHLDTTADQPITVLEETWEIARVDHATMHVFDLKSTQRCATEVPLIIQKYHYGAMCIRGRTEWLNKQAVMVTDGGLSREEGNHARPRWVTMHGEIDGQTCGITAMGHPSNFRAPQPVRLHPNKPYFCFAPMVLGDFSIEPDQPYVSQFRFVVFDGSPQREELNQLWEDFSAKSSLDPAPINDPP